MTLWRTARSTLVMAAVLAACGGSPSDGTPPDPPPPPPPPPGTLKVLMLGNSLTYSWDIPALVAEMAAQAGELRPQVVSFTGATATLESHWTASAALGQLRTGGFDVLVMQQLPPDNPNASDFLRDWSGRWADEARLVDTRPVLYAVWPPEGGELDVAIANNTAAANAKSMGMFPVAQAFRLAAQANPVPPVYGNDGYNPSPQGAWLAALIMVAMLFDRPVADFPNVLADRISSSEEAVLRSIATSAIAQFGLQGF
jgi:hypothetical protein